MDGEEGQSGAADGRRRALGCVVLSGNPGAAVWLAALTGGWAQEQGTGNREQGAGSGPVARPEFAKPLINPLNVGWQAEGPANVGAAHAMREQRFLAGRALAGGGSAAAAMDAARSQHLAMVQVQEREQRTGDGNSNRPGGSAGVGEAQDRIL